MPDEPAPEAARGESAPEIYGGPTKRFFVSMLTRDIELKDAILDLLDNCVDGAMRVRQSRSEDQESYDGFWAKITATPDRFEISDNCGGIPREIAEKSAFVLGRPDMTRDADLPTIGMYGIGMKRAIFKLGRDATVLSSPKESSFSVHYTPSWMDENNDEWKLPIDFNAAPLPVPGTKISVSSLTTAVRQQFDKDSPFIDELRQAIAVYYGYIMQKGFSVEVNDMPVEPQILRLYSEENPTRGDVIAPYYLKGEVDEVQFKIYIGFRRPIPSELEIDEEQISPRSSEDAGISIVCNDRLVLLNDKSRLTGWGEGGVPKYHNQFIAIGGHAMFYSTNASKLPLTTTKRGIDAATEIYLAARSYMIEGLKTATAYTYKWKGMEEQTSPYFQAAKPMEMRQFEQVLGNRLQRVREIEGAGRFSPRLPLPKDTNPIKRICFSRALTDIRTVATYLFDNPDARPVDVGGTCFDKMKEQAGP